MKMKNEKWIKDRKFVFFVIIPFKNYLKSNKQQKRKEKDEKNIVKRASIVFYEGYHDAYSPHF